MNKPIMQAVDILAPENQSVPGVAPSVNAKPLTIQDSLQIKAAEYWLKLVKQIRHCGIGSSAVEVLEMWLGAEDPAAMGVLRGRDEMTAQA
jgi:hypothetical protein